MAQRKQQGMGTHAFGKTGGQFTDPNTMYYFEQDGKLHAHTKKHEGITYLGRHAAIKEFGRAGLYAARGYKRG